MKKKAISVLAVSALAAAPALAQDGGALQRCRAIAEAPARLACYDAIPLAAPAAPAAAVAPAVPAAVVAAPVAAAAAPAVPAPVVAAAAPAASSQFGLDRRNPAAESQQVESQIVGTFEGWDARSLIKLANGQVWQIDDGTSASYALQSPKVKISRTMLGAYYLEIEGAKRMPRVRRVQ
ncbi:hypothetical protein [Roseateles violae]|uniref:Uncharacterized protein n=1 Tax=Roseateles violae TaxID=3058042 RepID=A0ABT8DRE0_9BURK|nr:hypothetical protein [Pelomonas sp. PFR6]MDN3918872.1 hypothetical protein [Pelomonas sp. PFR6]